MSLFKKLFGKKEEDDLEKYMRERENRTSPVSSVKAPADGVPENVIYTKQINDETYLLANYWNNGTFIIYDLLQPEADRTCIKIIYNLLYHRLETIDALLAQINNANPSGTLSILSELENLSLRMTDLTGKEEYSIYKNMGESREFMDAYLKLYKGTDSDAQKTNLFLRCVETVMVEGNIDYAIELMTKFLKLFQKNQSHLEEFAKHWFYVFFLTNSEDTYIPNYTKFKNGLKKNHFTAFTKELEKHEYFEETTDEIKKRIRAKIDEIVHIAKDNPSLAMQQWIALLEENKNDNSSKIPPYILFYDLVDAMRFEFEAFRGHLLLANEFLQHEEWFHYLICLKDDAYDVGETLIQLRMNKKYEAPIDALVKILHDAWDEETWDDFKDGYTAIIYDSTVIEKDALDQLLEEEVYQEKHNKHFQEMF